MMLYVQRWVPNKHSSIHLSPIKNERNMYSIICIHGSISQLGIGIHMLFFYFLVLVYLLLIVPAYSDTDVQQICISSTWLLVLDILVRNEYRLRLTISKYDGLIQSEKMQSLQYNLTSFKKHFFFNFLDSHLNVSLWEFSDLIHQVLTVITNLKIQS